MDRPLEGSRGFRGNTHHHLRRGSCGGRAETVTDKVQPGRHLAAVLACLPYAFFLLVSPSLAQEAAPRSAVRLFDYDERQPLDIREAGRFDRPGCTVVDLTYANP